MNNIFKAANDRLNELAVIKSKLEDSLSRAPEGALRIGGASKNKTNFYLRTNTKNTTGTYLKENQIDLVKALAQKDYDSKIVKEVSRELKCLNKFLEEYREVDSESIYDNLHPARQKLITPIFESDDEFVKNWKKQQYQGLSFDNNDSLFITDNNELVRSKSEILIANIFKRLGIPYKYECPLTLYMQKSHGTSPITIYPDFTLLDVRTRKEVYYEHFGMMDEPEYANKACAKINLYEQNGIYIGRELLVSFEIKKYPLNTKETENKIRKHFDI